MTRLIQIILVVGLLAVIAFGAKQQTFQATEHRDSLHAWFLNVGQGDAIFLDTPARQQVLIDGGPGSAVLSQLGRVMPLGDKEIDLLILTHVHADHMNGLIEVLRRYKVGSIWLSGATNTTAGYKNLLQVVKEKQVPVQIIQAGTKADFGDLHGIALTPFEDWTGQAPANQHDANVITFWQFGQETLLITGDGETEQEDELARRNLLRPVTILKVGHHGSYTSTGDALLTAIQPKMAIISVGTKNRYGHPHQSTLDRLAKFNIPVLRTDQSGAILCSITLIEYSCAGTK